MKKINKKLLQQKEVSCHDLYFKTRHLTLTFLTSGCECQKIHDVNAYNLWNLFVWNWKKLSPVDCVSALFLLSWSVGAGMVYIINRCSQNCNRGDRHFCCHYGKCKIRTYNTCNLRNILVTSSWFFCVPGNACRPLGTGDTATPGAPSPTSMYGSYKRCRKILLWVWQFPNLDTWELLKYQLHK